MKRKCKSVDDLARERAKAGRKGGKAVTEKKRQAALANLTKANQAIR